MSDRSKAGARGVPAGVDKAWASGRVLTAEQRARKQEVDRKANRFLKREVQDRLAVLEARVLELEATKSPQTQHGGVGGESAIHANQSAADFPATGTWPEPKERKQSWSSVATTHNALALAGPMISTPTALEYGQIAQHDVPVSSTTTAPGIQFRTVQEGFFPPSMGSGAGSDDTEEFIKPVNSVPAHPELTGLYTSAKPLPNGRDLTLFLNNLVNHIRSIPADQVCFDDQSNQDIVVNAVLKGWKHALLRYEQVCPLWEVLQMVDLCIFKDSNLVDRIAILRMLHKRYMFEIRNMPLQIEGPLPVWYQPQ